MNTRAILQELLDKEAENRVHVISVESSVDWGGVMSVDIRIQLLTNDFGPLSNALNGFEEQVIGDPSVEKAKRDKDRFEFTKKAVL